MGTGHQPEPHHGTRSKCIRQRRQWVAWKYITRDGVETKAPVNPTTGRLAASTNSKTWGTFEDAITACERKSGLAGVGFVFTKDDPYCGVDVDDAIDEATGNLKPWAEDIVVLLDSYTEISPSGTGLKIFLKASKPGNRCRKAHHSGEVEVYDRSRFFTVTGQWLPETPESIQDRQEPLQCVYGSLFGDDEVALAAPSAPSLGAQISDNGYICLDDGEIIELASNQRRTGAKFAALWSGNWKSHFPSASEADSSVVFTLAFYTKDAAQIDRLFRRSGLMRRKWDQTHGE